jgi:5'-phosphate synthase pdxT subunit
VNPGPTVGVLALQGGFRAHEQILLALGAQTRQVRTPEHLAGLDALVMPGGESTVMVLGVEREGLADPLRAFSTTRPVLATCAGLIMLDRDHLGVLDLTAQRNAFGRQTRSFEADLEFGDEFTGGPVHAVFIRAPWVSHHGPDVEVLAVVDQHPVAVRQGVVTALSFHPELSGERRFHRQLLDRTLR